MGEEAPASVDEMRYMGTYTATPFLVDFAGSKGGQTAYYWVRWVNKTGKTGPWGAPVSAMIQS